MKPELAQYGELTAAHFERHPVWVCAHVADAAESWHEETDEETFRPWTGSLPVDPDDGFYLVRATFTFGDGAVHAGFVVPQVEARRTREQVPVQAELFLPSGRRDPYWGTGASASPEVRAERLRSLVDELGTSADAFFPVRVAAVPGLTRGLATGTFDDLG